MTRATTISARSAIDVVEAAYALGGSDDEWLESVLAAARGDIDLGAGTYALTCRIDEGRLAPGTAFVTSSLAAEFMALVPALNATAPPALVRDLTARMVSCGSMGGAFGETHPGTLHFRRTVRPAGFCDGFSLFAQDAEGTAVTVSAPSRRMIEAAPRVVALWKKIGVHLATAARLRRRFAAKVEQRDARVEPAGKVRDATGRVASSAEVREAITAAARALDRARTAAGRRDPEAGLRVWRGLVAGEWSLVDHWERGGRRYLAAFRNRPDVRDPRALSAQERVVLRHASLGASNKEIAFALGVAASSVGDAISRVMRKLRCRRRSELVIFGDPAAWIRARVGDGEAAVDVLSRDVVRAADALAGLTEAERDVAVRALGGETNDAIARARATSPHTVAKQLRAVYARLGVNSRTEMVRRLTEG